MRHILDQLIKALENNEEVIIGGITRSSGSAPRTSGARMMVQRSGRLTGSVGGGAVEGACQEKAARMLAEGIDYEELAFNLTALAAADEGMVCGGNVTVLLIRVEPSQCEMFVQLRNAYAKGGQVMFITQLPVGNKPPVITFCADSFDGGLPPALVTELLRKPRRQPFAVEYESREYFVEPLLHPGTVHLIGAGHVAQATAVCADFAGFEVVVKDDRQDFANKSRYPQAKEVVVLSSFEDCLGKLGDDDYLIIVTRGHMYDRDVLAQALKTDAGYIGMIGSSRKRDGVYRSLLDSGFTEEDLKRVHCPIGLSIGADTPEEIGVSIVGELISHRAGLKR